MSPFWKQALEAAAWTFLQVFVVTLGPSLAGVDATDWKGLTAPVVSAGMAAAGAALSLIKSMIVRNLGAAESTLISASECELKG